jgi:hypothetical protein
MLAARTTARAVSNGVVGRRGLATAVETPFKIAAVDNGQSTASVTLVVKAGPRYETTPGAAHVLKNFAFKVLCRLIPPLLVSKWIICCSANSTLAIELGIDEVSVDREHHHVRR